MTDNRLQLWIARSCIDHNTKLYQFYPRDCAVNLNLWESPLWVRGGLSLLFGICDISRNCSTNKTILGLSSVWGTGLKSVTWKATSFTVRLSSSTSPSVIPSFPPLYKEAFKLCYFRILFLLKCKNHMIWFFWSLRHNRLFLLHLPTGTVFIGFLYQDKPKTRLSALQKRANSSFMKIL